MPDSGKLPNAPAPTLPVIVSPSTVAEMSSVIGIGEVICCFHASVSAQRKLACAVWATNPNGSGAVGECFQ